MSDNRRGAAVSLAQLAAGEDITGWNREALDRLCVEIGLPGAAGLETKQQVLEAIRNRVAEHKRATVPDPPHKGPRVYRVVGPHNVQGTKPGKTFVHHFTPEQEAALIQGGHIKIEKETV